MRNIPLQMPVEMQRGYSDFELTNKAIQLVTTMVSRGLEFPSSGACWCGHMPTPEEDENEAARVSYVLPGRRRRG
jgi:hypothetical protein